MSSERYAETHRHIKMIENFLKNNNGWGVQPVVPWKTVIELIDRNKLILDVGLLQYWARSKGLKELSQYLNNI